MNTHEYYVSLETARLLKQAGFDWEVYRCYETLPEKKKIFGRHLVPYQGKAREDVLPAPSLAVAQRWLREVKDLIISMAYTLEGWKSVITFPKPMPEKIYQEFVSCKDTYEQALEAGIQKCLTILLEEKK